MATAGAGATATAGAGNSGAAGAPSGDGGEGGTGDGEPVGCVWKPKVATHYNGFDGGLEGTGFDSVETTSWATTTHGATVTSGWDAAAGKTCPGAFDFKSVFPAYASGQEADEKTVADLRFSDADWSGGTKLHAWAKVSPVNAPITGVQFFVMSGSSFLYTDIFDAVNFAPGQWYELVVPLAPGAKYEPKVVHRVGVQIVLRRAGAANNPPVPVTVHVWLDDIWLE
jgi:hypothetical protein